MPILYDFSLIFHDNFFHQGLDQKPELLVQINSDPSEPKYAVIRTMSFMHSWAQCCGAGAGRSWYFLVGAGAGVKM